MRESEKKVGRADNNLEGARSVANDQPVDKPELDENSDPERPGSATWGSEGSGESGTDKRTDR